MVFVGAGSARATLQGDRAIEAVIICLILVLVGGALGMMTGFLLRLQRADRTAVLFPIGMREFGVATAVALVVAPRAVGIAGLYGIVIMASSAALAARLARSS